MGRWRGIWREFWCLGGRIGAGVPRVCVRFWVVPVGVAHRMRVRRGILAALGVRGVLSGHGDPKRMAGRYLRRDRYGDRCCLGLWDTCPLARSCFERRRLEGRCRTSLGGGNRGEGHRRRFDAPALWLWRLRARHVAGDAPAVARHRLPGANLGTATGAELQFTEYRVAGRWPRRASGARHLGRRAHGSCRHRSDGGDGPVHDAGGPLMASSRRSVWITSSARPHWRHTKTGPGEPAGVVVAWAPTAAG